MAHDLTKKMARHPTSCGLWPGMNCISKAFGVALGRVSAAGPRFYSVVVVVYFLATVPWNELE